MDKSLLNFFIMKQLGGKSITTKKWKTFSHNGVIFEEPYKQHNIPLLYNKTPIQLNKESEEYATLYSKFLDTEYVKSKKFNINFFKDWKHYLKKGNLLQIKDFLLCDFSLIYEHILKERENKKKLTIEEKNKIKDKNNEFNEKFKYAFVDGIKQEVGNYMLEPAMIFTGRGCNPKSGKIKKRILPEDITINIDKQSKIPELPEFYKNHKWGDIIHNNTAEWLASWKNSYDGKIKYVWLSSKSIFKEKSDIQKFELARKLKKNIINIRKTNYDNLISKTSDDKIKQLATALYLIDTLALRVGTEKSNDDTDTVGVCTLRVEHITLLDNYNILLDFLGKDSVRYKKQIKIDDSFYNALIVFTENKKKNEDIFDKINATELNNYIDSMMTGATAKIFRTYNACILLQDELNLINKKFSNYNNEDKVNLLIDAYNKAILRVAILCNHQKQISKTFDKQIQKINKQIKDTTNKKNELNNKENKTKTDKLRIKKLTEKIKELKNKKEYKNEFKNMNLSTSQLNYLDARITVAFLKKNKIPIEDFLKKNYIERFKWAFDVDENWLF